VRVVEQLELVEVTDGDGHRLARAYQPPGLALERSPIEQPGEAVGRRLQVTSLERAHGADPGRSLCGQHRYSLYRRRRPLCSLLPDRVENAERPAHEGHGRAARRDHVVATTQETWTGVERFARGEHDSVPSTNRRAAERCVHAAAGCFAVGAMGDPIEVGTRGIGQQELHAPAWSYLGHRALDDAIRVGLGVSHLERVSELPHERVSLRVLGEAREQIADAVGSRVEGEPELSELIGPAHVDACAELTVHDRLDTGAHPRQARENRASDHDGEEDQQSQSRQLEHCRDEANVRLRRTRLGRSYRRETEQHAIALLREPRDLACEAFVLHDPRLGRRPVREHFDHERFRVETEPREDISLDGPDALLTGSGERFVELVGSGLELRKLFPKALIEIIRELPL
jgi:hypothetical protein